MSPIIRSSTGVSCVCHTSLHVFYLPALCMHGNYSVHNMHSMLLKVVAQKDFGRLQK